MIDWSRIDPYLVRENFNLGLGFRDGYIFFRVSHRELFPYLYDLHAEMPDVFKDKIDPNTYITVKELKCDTLAATNIFEVKQYDHIYQVFTGISPNVLRMFPAYPRETEINQLDVGLHLPAYPYFGFWDGFESPLDKPSPKTMLFIPYGPRVGWAFYNYGPTPIKPMLRFIINRLRVVTITNPNLISKIIERRVECTFATIGGVDAPWFTTPQNYVKWWGMLPVSLLYTKPEIEETVRRAAELKGRGG